MHLNLNKKTYFILKLLKIFYIFFFRELNLSSNLLRGPLIRDLLPVLKSLESLNLGTNLLTSIHTGAFENFPFLIRLILRHNQIDVLQDHSFSGLNSLQVLDLSHNGIVAISGASLKHLSRLLVLNLTHNFLRYVYENFLFLVSSSFLLNLSRKSGKVTKKIVQNQFSFGVRFGVKVWDFIKKMNVQDKSKNVIVLGG